MRKVLGIALAVALLTGAFVATGCGSSSPASGPATAGGMTVAQILAKSDQAMNKVKSARFTGDVTIKVSSSGSSAQAMLLGQAPIVLHVAGAAGDAARGTAAAKGTDKTAAVVDMTLHAAGQTIPIGLKTVGGRTWLRFQGTWYVAPKSKTGAAKGAGAAGISSGSLGIDPSNVGQVDHRNQRAARWGDGLPRGGHGRHDEDHGRHRQGARTIRPSPREPAAAPPY